MKTKSYDPFNLEIQRRIRTHLDAAEIKTLHERSAWKHFALLARQVLLLVGIGAAAYHVSNPWVWIPLAVLQGFVILSFIILLHEQVHNAIFARRRPRVERVLGLLYGLPSGISATQFKRWHLDHHNELGSETEDPKRAYLTPKIVTRWYKFLYMTPALFVIYSIASGREARSYPAGLRRTINLEKAAAIGLHALFAWWLWSHAGFEIWARVHFVPLFLTFPFAFTLNRLGQHYAIDPGDPAKWSTLVNSHWFWDRIFVYSNLHLEHHYLVGVPCYNLPRLNRALQGFYREIGHEPYGYGRILYHWFIRNAVPHTRWSRGTRDTAPAAAGGAPRQP
jgi:fatty acid desaturase